MNLTQHKLIDNVPIDNVDKTEMEVDQNINPTPSTHPAETESTENKDFEGFGKRKRRKKNYHNKKPKKKHTKKKKKKYQPKKLKSILKKRNKLKKDIFTYLA